ncbi:hypothetical protein ABK040_002049 [Willaertia magna]
MKLSSSLLTKTPDLKVKHLIIGSGVIGLATGLRLSQELKNSINNSIFDYNTLVIERNKFIGQETSSRNSEVIHAGLYYEENSLKTKLCCFGNNLLYNFCNKYQVPFKKIGKWIIANGNDDYQINYLKQMKDKTDKIFERYQMSNDMKLRFLSDKERLQEVNLKKDCNVVLFSKNTGIINSHELMSTFRNLIIENESDVIVNSCVTNIVKYKDKYLVQVNSPSLTNQSTIEPIYILADTIINCAGLDSERIARIGWNNIVGEEDNQFPSDYELYYYKGHYFKYLDRNYNVNHLLYPVPPDTKGLVHGLGIHATLDLNGNLKFGPDSDCIGKGSDLFGNYLFRNNNERIDSNQHLSMETISHLLYPYYKVDLSEEKKEIFYKSISNYLMDIDKSKLQVDYVGIRPKLKSKDGKIRDFVIEKLKNENRFINLIGIESPGLTSCLAIGNYVANLLGYSQDYDFK